MKDMLSDINGSVSSKRVVMFILLFMFLVSCLSNLFYGKLLAPTLQDQLYYMLIWVISSVFGEQIVSLFKK